MIIEAGRLSKNLAVKLSDRIPIGSPSARGADWRLALHPYSDAVTETYQTLLIAGGTLSVATLLTLLRYGTTHDSRLQVKLLRGVAVGGLALVLSSQTPSAPTRATPGQPTAPRAAQ